MIGIADYEAGNLRNVRAALRRLGAAAKDVRSPADLADIDGLILPGVGHFGAAARKLEATGLSAALRGFARSGKPFLGICAGMQLLFERSEEDPSAAGLGLFPGQIERLKTTPLPHIGWTVVEAGPAPLAGGPLAGLPRRFFAYFAHSYAMADAAGVTAASSDCPPSFCSVAARDNLWATQFHPEKSGLAGLQVLRNFVARATGSECPAEAGLKPADDRARRAHRVIPCLDVRGGRVVKGIRFQNLADAGDPVERARAYDRDGADEICLLDVSASIEERRPLLGLVRRVADELTVPFSVGGGIRTTEEMRELLLAGADRVSIGTAAVERPELVSEASAAFGAQFVIVSIDALGAAGRGEVTTHGGRRRTGIDAVAWAEEMQRRGAGEILLNAMSADGTRAGYDIELTRAVVRAVRIPVIASGGAGSAEDMAAVLDEGEADAALAASILHDGSTTIAQIKDVLAARGISVRR